MAISSTSSLHISRNSRLGLHYFPDTLHYREADLQTWLPELQESGASWLVLNSEQDRAIPEQFLRGLKQAGIEPIIRFQLSLEGMPNLEEMGMLLEIYARWGARYVVFFDRPNARSAWPVAGWVQQDLVERFLDRYLPVAGLALQYGLTPVFPPLEPGGSYWDTAFLRSALQAMQRRKQEILLQRLVLSAYAWTGDRWDSADPSRRSLDWGAGGPERWPQARPYQLARGSQDQRGFRIFDWYQAIARSVLHQDYPVILFNAGLPGDPRSRLAGNIDAQEQAATEQAVAELAVACTNIARLLAGEMVADPCVEGNVLEPVPQQVISCNFWLLSADPASPYFRHAWYEDKEKKRPVVDALRAWRREAGRRESDAALSIAENAARSIQHYLLLPGYEWGVSDWYLEVIRPFVKKHRPTVGFSVEEAEKATRVTVVGNRQNYPEDIIGRLQKAGCQIEQICGNGTNIATELSER